MGPPELPGNTLRSSKKVGKVLEGASGNDATRPDLRIGKPAGFDEKPSGKPNASISSPGLTAYLVKVSSVASQVSGSATLATCGGGSTAMTATSRSGWCAQSSFPP